MSKNRRKGRIYSVRTGATPTKERRRQNGGVIAEVIDRDADGKILIRRYRAEWECPLDAYLAHKAISESQHKAGLKFRRAYLSAILGRRREYEQLESNDVYLEPSRSEKLLKEAYRTLPSHYKGIVIDICGHDLPARDAAKLDGLQKGLGQLAELWKTAAMEVCWR